ncbi:Hypp3365 [Branchiostoma lanceolatum]|uniref:Hypp3365 protein n=1 Tax=Branchiostoma lanceolatum TaxID=7740 RepID=A0A8K0ERX5_BRALA|nr:Hypp3365 [Branchiostoma lanceolatum]
MLVVCEKLREADAKGRRYGLARAETGYLRALVDAMADMDRLAEVELLKSLGDVNLEKGRLGKDVGKFKRALALYMAARVRCDLREQGEGIEHRYEYTERLLQGGSSKGSQGKEQLTEDKETTTPTKVAIKFQDLDKRRDAGGNTDSVLVGYAQLMIEGIVNGSNMLETEAIKSIGDVYLRRGTETRNTEWLTKAAALYNSALARCNNVHVTVVIVHRLQHIAKIRHGITATKNKRPTRPKRQDVSRRKSHFPPFSAAPSNDVIGGGMRRMQISYRRYIQTADRDLGNGELDAAERNLAAALKLIHDPSKSDKAKEADCLCRLGDVYVERGKQTREGRKFTQAAALYNASMARTDGDKQNMIRRLQETEMQFLRNTCNIDCEPCPYSSASDHRKELDNMRARVKSKLETIHEQHNPYQYDEDDPAVRDVEIKRAEAIKNLLKSITVRRQEFIQLLTDECIAKLGPPLCKYVFIGLGSQATELATPYSDLEFAILIEEGKDDDDTQRYFRNLTHYLHLKVINLGETILPAMAIPSLNDFLSEDPEKDWFFDSVTPRGFAFDGCMPWASKTPFGRDKTKSKPPVSLIQTPAKLAEYQHLYIALSEGYHLSDILRRVTYLTGDESLVDEYMENVNKRHSFAMLRVCEKLCEADAKGRRYGLARAETGYLLALVDAMAEIDRLAEVELLKSLGDVNLEKGRLRTDLGKLNRALSLYMAARVRCDHREQGEGIEHRYKYTKRLLQRVSSEESGGKEQPTESKGTTTTPAKVTRKFQDLDKQLSTGGNTDSVLVGYAKVMVEGIVNGNNMLEVEAIKSIGDVYLKRGTETKNTPCLTKATALYNTALTLCYNVQGTVAIIHRLLHTAKIRQDIAASKTKRSARTQRQQSTRGRKGNFSPFSAAPPNDVSNDGLHRLHMYMQIADCDLGNGDLDAAEQNIVEALKLVHDPSIPNKAKEADCLCKLGDVYVERGKRTGEGRKFTQAAALYNASMARTDGDKQNMIRRLQETEIQFLRNTCNIDCEPCPYSSALDHKKQLDNSRARVKSQLETIHEQHNPYQYDEDDPVVREVEIKRAEAIKNLFKSITVGRQEFIQLLTDECIAKLGPPPCKYAFIGLGSQATELVTPYSDLEFAILIEEGKDDDDTQGYFRNVTHFLHLKVINLGETILPAMAIPSLNDFLSEDPEKDWFFDSVTPRGFAFDGFMPWASKTPFGRDKTKSKPPVSLIQTPDKLAEYQHLHIAVAEGYHLSDILRRVTYLTGDESLVDEYMKNMNKMLRDAFMLSTVTASAASAGSSIDNLRRLLIEKFSTNRHHAANPENKEATRVFLTQTFESYGLDVTMQAFTSKTRSQGKNVIGTLPGRHTGTSADRPVLLAAHYDTVRDSPGVIDNGSGMAALLESARLITSQQCHKPNHTVIFVAFDFEESAKEGSEAYVSDVLVPYLNETGIPPANFQGAICMDPILNYNNTEGSQYIPPEFDMVPDPDNTYKSVAADGFRGNFIWDIWQERLRRSSLHPISAGLER